MARAPGSISPATLRSAASMSARKASKSLIAHIPS